MGSGGYFAALHQGRLVAQVLPDVHGYGYSQGISTLSKRAKDALTCIYEDLCNNQEILRYIPEDRHSLLGDLVRELDSICQLSGGFDSTAASCLSLLGSAFFSSRSMATDRERSSAEELLSGGGESGLSFFERVSLLKEASVWGMVFAAGGNLAKETFLKELKQINSGSDFLQEVWTAQRYREAPWEFCGKNGYELCSEAYIKNLEEQVLFGGFLGTGVAGRIREELGEIYREIEADILTNLSQNNYITDDFGRETEAALRELSLCGSLRYDAIIPEVRKLCWYTSIDPGKASRLQELLNQLELGEKLQEDGVYGKKTLDAWSKFISIMEHGLVPTLVWIDSLQSRHTGLEYTFKELKNGEKFVRATVRGSKFPVARLDKHPFNGVSECYHINFQATPNAPKYQKTIASTFDHMRISKTVYEKLKNFDDSAKIVRIGGRVLLVAGILVDALEMGTCIEADLKDADKKLGHNTVSTAIRIGGRWGGAVLGAKVGAVAGGFTGPLAPIAVPALGLPGGVGGAIGGDAFAKWIVDITCIGE